MTKNRRRGALAACLVCMPLASFAAKPRIEVVIDAITYKENGRIDEKVVSECHFEQQLRRSMAQANGMSRKRRNASRTAQKPQIHVDLQIDKLAKMTWSGKAPHETQIAVTASMREGGAKQYFTCMSRSTVVTAQACVRSDNCTDKLTKQIFEWAAKQPTTAQENP